MGALTHELGKPTKHTINGKVWTLTRSTWGIQDDWSTWLADRALKAAEKVAAGYRKQLEPLQRDLNELRKRGDSDKPMTDAEREAINVPARELIAKINELDRLAEKTLERYQDRLAAGEFEFYSATVGQMAQTNLPGQFYLIWLCLLPNHPGMTLQDVIKEHVPGGQVNFIQEWRQALLISEGIAAKNDGPAASDGSTPTSPDPKSPTTEAT